MKTRLIIDGNAVYEIDEECEACQQKNQKNRRARENGVRKIFPGSGIKSQGNSRRIVCIPA